MIEQFGLIAQMVEQLTLNQWVQGSSPCQTTSLQIKVKLILTFLFPKLKESYSLSK